MRITARLVLSVVVAVAAVAVGSALIQMGHERHIHERDLERRSRIVADGIETALDPLLEKSDAAKTSKLVERFGGKERLAGVALYRSDGTLIAATASLRSALAGPPVAVNRALRLGAEDGSFQETSGLKFFVYARPILHQGERWGVLALFHDSSFIEAQLADLWRRTFLRILVQTVLIALVVLLVVRWTIVSPVAQLSEWMKQIRAGLDSKPPALPRGDLFAPLAKEAETFAKHLTTARAAAEHEAMLRRNAETLWTPDRLRDHVRNKLKDRPLFVLSNREPYMHMKKGRDIQCIVPAGGLVTALEPVLRASGGTWVAHGSGTADWETVDELGKVRVPPEDPVYTLRRVALPADEEKGYYYGFANEGLWPLCHIAHTRPVFRPDDWAHYQRANQRFVDALLEEVKDVDEPCVLVQDYHMALAPRLIKEKRPDARVAIFWHIPWPNPEAFGICPWQKDLLLGMLGADLIGFHTQFFCNNFFDTVDRVLESRLDWERFAVVKDQHRTLVKPFPISVAFPDAFQDLAADVALDRPEMLRRLGPEVRHLGVGVERMDYTKGVLERFRAIERFFEKYPAYLRKFVFVQIGAPSRTGIKLYDDFLQAVEEEGQRINARYGTGDWQPIHFLKKHHSHDEIMPWYRAADVCMVTSLHDGMNLVAKEFVAAREDEGGALILSRFAGASRELGDALIINPYDAEQVADAILYAIEMDGEERQNRMRRMRAKVREHNIYRWAGNLIEALTEVQALKAHVRG